MLGDSDLQKIWHSTVLFCLHCEMHRALSLLPRRTQQLRETGETGEHKGLKYRKEVREGGKYARERIVFSKE